MRKKLLSILYRPYPLPETTPGKLKTAAILSLVVFAFLFMLHPLSSSPSVWRSFWGSLVGGVTVFVVVCFYYFILFGLFPGYFKEERWNIGRELLWTLCTIVMIALANTVVVALMGGAWLSFHNILKMIGYTAIVGVAPVSVSIILNQMRLLRRYGRSAVQLNESMPPVTPEAEAADKIVLVAENGKDMLEVPVGSLLAITSADNYTKVYTWEGGQLKVTVLRNSLQRAVTALAAHPFFWRCHRTALVNLREVQTISGTAQGYRLHLAGLPDPLPVSRSLNGELRERLAHRL